MFDVVLFQVVHQVSSVTLRETRVTAAALAYETIKAESESYMKRSFIGV